MATEAVTLQSLRRCEDQPRPAGKETKPPDWSDRTKPAQIGESNQIKAPAEKKNPREKQPPPAAIDHAVKCENKQRDRVNKMIKDGFVPDIQRATQFESRFQAVRSECSERDGQEAERGCNPKQRNRHFAISSEFGASPTAFLDRSMLIAGVGESFSHRKSFRRRREPLLRESLVPAQVSTDTRQELRQC